jgi:transposase-like protein
LRGVYLDRRREFKFQVIREIEAGKTQCQVAREYPITENTISRWRLAPGNRSSSRRRKAYASLC